MFPILVYVPPLFDFVISEGLRATLPPLPWIETTNKRATIARMNLIEVSELLI